MKITVLIIAAVIVFIVTGVLFALYLSGVGTVQYQSAGVTTTASASSEEKVTVSQKSFEMLGKSKGDEEMPEYSEGPYFYGAYCFEVTNTTGSAIALEDYFITFLDSKGRILASEQSYVLVPRIIQPGEKSYGGGAFYIETIKRETDIAKMEVSVGFEKTAAKEAPLTIENINILETLSGSVKITGEATNKTDSYIYPTIVAVSFDKNGKLLDVSESFDTPGELRPGRMFPFEIDVENKNVKKTDIADIQVFGVSDPMMSY